jgi:O-antigen/teichoic acid export membrane protein
MFLAPTVALLSAFAPSAIRFFYGAKYTPAAPAMSILAVGLGFLTVFYILTFTLNGAGKNKIPMRMAILGAGLNAILNYLFIPRWGIIGSALATSTTSFLVMLALLFYAHYQLAAFIQPKAVAKYLILSGALYWLGVHIFPQGRFIFIGWSILLMATYILALIILKEIDKKDWQYLLNALQKKKSDNKLA